MKPWMTGLMHAGCRALLGAVIAQGSAQALSLETARLALRNHQPFAIHMPITVRGLSDAEGSWTTDQGQPVQVFGSNLVLIADLEASARKTLSFKRGNNRPRSTFDIVPITNGVTFRFSANDLGRLSWGIVLKPVNPSTGEQDQTPRQTNIHATFEPLTLSFQREREGSVFDLWTAEATYRGLALKLELMAYHEGFLDLTATLANESADEQAKVYCAVVCRWEQPRSEVRTFCYDNRIAPLGERSASPFRAGEGRHQFTQRGVDWVRTRFADNVTAAWLNDFAPSFTLLDPSTRNTFKQARYQGASLPQLGQEIQTDGDNFYSITEIARGNIRSYRDRLAEFALPARGDSVRFSSRLVLRRGALTDQEVDQMLVGFTSYNEQLTVGNQIAFSFGVRSVRFGTSYFPYSTLGENFDIVKLPGMDREAFWPLAADTVLRWREFEDEIRRDLRIAKAMGFELIRLHHLELLASIPKEVRTEYLDFLFGELDKLQLKALLDTYASDAAIVELLQRYGKMIDTIEIENEVLIWGIPLDRPQQWKQTYAAIKQVAPHVRVHLTGYNNTGMFNRLAALEVPFDRVGLHSYVDSLDAIPTARGYALALGSFCSRIGKPPVITEWNWRQLTRMTPESRAKIYPAIFENALATRAIPEMYQFQFNETLAPNPRIGRGNVLRHYELIHLSRRPKLEALELMKLIEKYVAEDDEVRLLKVPRTVVHLDKKGQAESEIRITNTSQRRLDVIASLETPPQLKAKTRKSTKLSLEPGETVSVPIRLKLLELTPGFYHAFVRLAGKDGFLRYGWIEARFKGAPKLDTQGSSPISASVVYPRGVSEELKVDFTQPVTVVYGSNAPVLEVETAMAIAGTLESAAGIPVEAIQENDLPKGGNQQNLIVVGTPDSNALIGGLRNQLPDANTAVARINAPGGATWLVVVGGDSLSVERAGIDLLLRWWMNAKDSVARRVGLVQKELPRGGDATKLP